MTVTIANPLREGLRLARTPEPACLVIFGASGDLTARKLMPALYNLALQHLLPASFAVIGSARRQMTADAFRKELHDAVAEFSRITCESYPSFQTMAQPPEQKTQPYYLEAPGMLRGLSILCQLLSD